MKWVYLKIEQQNYGAVTIRDEFKKDPVKCYLRYKTILSQNVRSEVQVKNFFISQKRYVPFSRYSSFCIFHNMICQICYAKMRIGT